MKNRLNNTIEVWFMKKRNQYIRNTISVYILSFLVSATSVYSGELFSDLMKGQVATVTDAVSLLFHSVKTLPKAATAEKNQTTKLNEDEIRHYLQARGMHIPSANQPVTRQEFARTLITWFDLKTSFWTDITGSLKSYYEDAQHLGIFSRSALGAETLDTREMLKAYLAAEELNSNNK